MKLKKAGKFTGKIGFPKFKSKKCGLGSFRLTGKICVQPSRIKLPRLGWLKQNSGEGFGERVRAFSVNFPNPSPEPSPQILKERGYIPTDNIKILLAMISERAGHWFVSVQVEKKYREGNWRPRRCGFGN